jgi:hypothetical protein
VVTIDCDHAASGANALKECSGDPAAAEGGVDRDLPRFGLQVLYEWV